MINFHRLHSQYDAAAELLRSSPHAAIHFTGIGGVGMAGLADLLHTLGYDVSGCDSSGTSPFLDGLRTSGIPCAVGHDASHANGIDALVRTAAAPLTLPEIAAAPRVLDRGCLLAALFDSFPTSIAVCGTHGKTTTATFTAGVLRSLGNAPGWCIGGTSYCLGSLAHLDADPTVRSTAPFVAECDESDGTLALYHPFITVLTSLDFDHAEHYESPEEFRSVFRSVLRQTRGAIVYHADNPELAHELPPHLPTLSFGFSPNATVRAIRLNNHQIELFYHNQSLGTYFFVLPGDHNLLNLLAALAVRFALDPIPPPHDPLQNALGLSLPDRRFQFVANADHVQIISDYAHHPTEIAALIQMARSLWTNNARILGVFQPHRYSRTRALGPDFPAAFRGLDALAIAPVYAASETPVPGGDSADLYALFREQGFTPTLLPTLQSAIPWIQFNARPFDVVLLIGAGDIVSLIPAFSNPSFLSLEDQPSAAPFCSYGVGGPMLPPYQVKSLSELLEAVDTLSQRNLPYRVIGAGTNILVSDAGFLGHFIRLEGPAFQECTALPASNVTPTAFRVGAGLPGASLLKQWIRYGLLGLECMTNIPGTIGGWIATNAGSQGYAVSDCLRSVTLLDGITLRTLPRDALTFHYRHASWNGRPLSDFILLEAEFAPLRVATPSEVEVRCVFFRSKRFTFAGLHTAGSVFRNPPNGPAAGRLLDDAGLKGLRIGGAEISPQHANIFVAHPGCTPSDLLALIRIAQLRSPIPLEPEITLL